MSTSYNPSFDRNGLLYFIDAQNIKCWAGGSVAVNLADPKVAQNRTGTVASSVILDNDSVAGNCFSHSISGVTSTITSNLTCGSNVTIIWSMYPREPADNIPISLNSDATVSGPNLFYNANVACWNVGDAATATFGVGYPTTNQWGIFAITNVFGSYANYYLNGVRIGRTTAYSRNTTTTNGAFVVGDYHGGGYSMPMKTQFAAFFNRAMTDEEVYRFYLSFRGRYGV